jgi:hypothetical protein
MVMEKTRRAGLNWQRLGLRVAGAGLLAVAGAMHLDLYLTGYRSIPVIGWLFLLQVIAAFALAAAVLVSGSRLAAAAGAGFALSTLGGYLLSVWIGLFGFKEIRTTAGIAAGVIEVSAFAALAVLALSPPRSTSRPGQWRLAAPCWPGCRRACRVPGRRPPQCRLPRWCCWVIGAGPLVLLTGFQTAAAITPAAWQSHREAPRRSRAAAGPAPGGAKPCGSGGPPRGRRRPGWRCSTGWSR